MGVVVIPQEYPYLDCGAPGCGQPMPLPRSSQLGKSPNVPGLIPPDIREIFVNPQSGHVCDYTERDVHWRPVPHVAPDQPGQPFSALVQWNCDIDNCGARVVVQRPTRGTITPDELMREARQRWRFVSAHCPKGHALTHIPDDAWSWEIWAADLPSG